MNPFPPRPSRLRWAQTSAWQARYELTSGADVVGELAFRTVWGSYAEFETVSGSWSFKRVGFLNPRVTVRAIGSESDLAEFHPRTWSGGGTLRISDGREYQADTNFWSTRFQFSATGTALVAFERIAGLTHLSSDVVVGSEAAAVAELPWLVGLGWYLTILMHNDAASVVIA